MDLREDRILIGDKIDDAVRDHNIDASGSERESLDLTLDFAAKDVAGTATLDVEAAAGAGAIILDSNGLRIERVRDGAGAPLAWQMGAKVESSGEAKGEPLTCRE